MSVQGRRYLRFGAVIVVIVVSLGYLAYTGVHDSKSYYVTIKELNGMGPERLQQASARSGQRRAGIDQAPGNPPGVSAGGRRPDDSGGVRRQRSASGYIQGQCPGAGRRQVWQAMACSTRPTSRPSALRSTLPSNRTSRERSAAGELGQKAELTGAQPGGQGQ